MLHGHSICSFALVTSTRSLRKRCAVLEERTGVCMCGVGVGGKYTPFHPTPFSKQSEKEKNRTSLCFGVNIAMRTNEQARTDAHVLMRAHTHTHTQQQQKPQHTHTHTHTKQQHTYTHAHTHAGTHTHTHSHTHSHTNTHAHTHTHSHTHTHTPVS